MSGFNDEWLGEDTLGGHHEEDSLPSAVNVDGGLGITSNIVDQDDKFDIAVNDVEEAAPKAPSSTRGQNANSYEVSARLKRQRKKIIGSAVFVLIIVICIAVGVSVSKKKKDKNSAPPPSADEDNKNTTDSNNQNNTTGDNSMDESGVIDTEDRYYLPYLGDAEGVVLFNSSSVGAFEVEIPTIASSSAAGVYESESEVRDGLSRMALFLMNNAVARLIGTPGFDSAGYGASSDSVNDDSRRISESRRDAGVGNSNDPFAADKQEHVDMADFAKSDGKSIFAAYGSKLLSIDAIEGKRNLVLDVSASECPESGETNDSNTTDTEEEETQSSDSNVTDVESNKTESSNDDTDRRVLAPSDCQEVQIESILLDKNQSRLALIVSGYRDEGDLSDTIPVLSDLQSTRLLLYRITEGGISLLGTTNLNGQFLSGFVIDDTGIAHIATMSSLNTREWLVNPIEELQDSDKSRRLGKRSLIEEAEFKNKVRLARSDIVGKFVEEAIKELSMTTGSLPRIAHLKLPVDAQSGVEGFENVLLPDGYGNAIIQMTSFDMGGDTMEIENDENRYYVAVNQTIQFLPDSGGIVYSLEEMMVVTGLGYSYKEDIEASEDLSLLYVFGFDGAMTTPSATGKVAGSLPDRHSLDYFEGLFRAATRTSSWSVDELLPEGIASGGSGGSNDGEDGDEVDGGSGGSGDGGDGSEEGDGNLGTNSTDGEDGDSEIDIRRLQGDPGNKPGNKPDNDAGSETSASNSTVFSFLSECKVSSEEFDAECFDNETMAECIEMTDRGCSSVVFSKVSCGVYCLDDLNGKCPLPSPEKDTPCLTGDNFAACVDLVAGGCKNIAILESCPFQVQCSDDQKPPPSDSKSTNQIFVLQLPPQNESSTEMVIVGNVVVGEPEDVLSSVRYFDNRGYALFLESELFYIISFDDPENPEVLGKVDFNVFTEYMHFINDDKTLLLILGKGTDENGKEVGLQISLFNTTDPINPIKIAQRNGTSSSDSTEWDLTAFQFLKANELEGRIIIPVSSQGTKSDDDFYGFEVFEKSPAGIFPLSLVSHLDSHQDGCPHLPERSFLIEETIVTLRGQSVRGHELTSGEFAWGLDYNDTEFCS
mmetsp:Transcript_26961/g.44450  ORF Transcript_26961/g.44450 Transcript_26961/m.44450 type:complete len:1104 (+) Transcript_26961:125-3436(+)